MKCKLIGAVGIALAGCASNPYPGTPEDLPRRVEESEAGTTIEMARGKRVTLRLEANHSTGHRWFLAASGDAGLEQMGEAFYTQEKAVPGGGGAEYWTFRATRGGKKELRFEYRRPWERDKPAAKGLSYTINVR
jgi:predicted secreted protein